MVKNMTVDQIKQLLEKAAASINYDLSNTDWVPPVAQGFWGFKTRNKTKYRASHFFNPLSSRSTALDIAIQLNIRCEPANDFCSAFYKPGLYKWLFAPLVRVRVDSVNLADKQAAMCEAITTAASIVYEQRCLDK